MTKAKMGHLRDSIFLQLLQELGMRLRGIQGPVLLFAATSATIKNAHRLQQEALAYIECLSNQDMFSEVEGQGDGCFLSCTDPVVRPRGAT